MTQNNKHCQVTKRRFSSSIRLDFPICRRVKVKVTVIELDKWAWVNLMRFN